MKKDRFHTRLHVKLFKEIRLWHWRKWVANYQDVVYAEKEILKSLNVKTKDQAVQQLRNQQLPDLIQWGYTSESISSDKHVINPTVSILGSYINTSEIYRNWNKDWVSGYEWPTDWHWKVKTVRYDGSDVKIPWELSRCQFLTQWARAFAISENPEIAASFVTLLESWIESNPVGKGVNWTCAMEVAIRAVNWLIVFPEFIKSNIVTDEFVWNFYKSVYAHGKYLESNLEGPGWYAANHYISDLAGLYFIGSMCPAFSTSEKWTGLAKKELEKEIRRQILPDGTCFEQSTAYHRLTFEIFYYPYWLSTMLGNKFSGEYVARLERMLAVVDVISKPSGKVPQIGDNDNGQFIKFGQDSIMDYRYLMDIGVTQFGITYYKYEKRDVNETAMCLGGINAITNWSKAAINDKYKYGIRCLSDSGWHVIENSNWWLFVNTGASKECSHAAHAHDDRLSVEVTCVGQDIIVDAGTYTYTRIPEERMQFRSASYHNKLRFENTVQNSEECNGIFYGQAPEAATFLDSIESAGKLQWRGALALEKEQWSREINVTQNECRVLDTVTSTDNIKGSLNIHPEVTVKMLDLNSGRFKLILQSGDKITMKIIGAKNIHIAKSWYSPEYGVKKETCQILYDVCEEKSGFSLEMTV